MKPKIAIILLNWNGKTDTLECLASLEKLEKPSPVVLVVDNASTDDSVRVIRKTFPGTLLLESKENLGYAGGNNLGIAWALRHKAEWILLLNNDTTVPPDLLSSLLLRANKSPEVKIWGPKILRYHKPDLIDHFGGMWRADLGEFISLHAGEEDHPFLEEKEVDYVCGAALFAHRSVFEKVGLLEPRFFLFWEESDFCMRAKKEGFEVRVTPHAKIWHKVSSSFIGGKPHMHYFWWRSRLLWIERNCSSQEKKELYQKIVFPQIKKLTRHFFIKWALCFFFPSKKRKEQKKRLKAGLMGVIHFYIRRFGSGPSWLFR